MIPFYAGKPLQFEPGTKWQYCQSGINSLGRIVEIVSGQSFPAFLQQRLFDPLGMKDTTFYLSAEQFARLAKTYRRTETTLEEDPLDFCRAFAHRPRPLPGAQWRFVLHGPGLRHVLPDDPQPGHARREALFEAGVSQTDDQPSRRAS